MTKLPVNRDTTSNLVHLHYVWMKKLIMVIWHYPEISTLYLWIQTPIPRKLIFLTKKDAKLLPNI